MARLCTRVKQLRAALGVSQRALASKAGISLSTLVRYERNQVTSFDAEVLDKLGRALNVEPSFLIVRCP
jgi:transcriptional regulator with XRE-family HTH domain